MDDRELYATILGVTSPWRVEGVVLKEKEEVVEVTVGANAGHRVGLSDVWEGVAGLRSH